MEDINYNTSNPPSCKAEKRIAIYVRVSSEEQARHGGSIADQLQALRKWAEENGYHRPLEYLDEGYSARKSYRTRPALKRLLEDVEADRISIIVFTKLDRWFRSLRDYYAVQTILDEHGVGWNAILEEYSTLDSASRLLLNLRLTIAEHEADLTGDRIRFTFAQKRARGEIISTSVSIGYRVEGKKPVRDDAMFPAIKAFWDEYTSTGRLNIAVEKANALGANLTQRHACGMLRNADQYAGHIQGIETYAYITDAQAQRVLANRNKRARATGAVHLYNGIIYCSLCGGRMSAQYTRRTRASDGAPIRYTSYFCPRYVDKRCSMRIRLNENKIEEQLLNNIEAELDAYIIEANAQAKQQKRQDDPSSKIADLEAKAERLLDLYLDGGIPKARYSKRRADIDDEIARLSMMPVVEQRQDPEALKAALSPGWKTLYSELDNDHKRAFWFQMLEKIIVNPDRTVSFSFIQ